jgi:MinD-like ATPase involved in chromosome partitioning or flagellar assembly
MRVRLVTAGPGAAWEAAVVEACRWRPARVEVVQRCYDLADLLGAAAAGRAQVALVADGLRWLDQDALATLGAAGTAVVAVASPADPESERRLRRLGVERVASTEDDPDRLLDLVEAASDRPELPEPAHHQRRRGLPPGHEPDPNGRGGMRPGQWMQDKGITSVGDADPVGGLAGVGIGIRWGDGDRGHGVEAAVEPSEAAAGAPFTQTMPWPQAPAGTVAGAAGQLIVVWGPKGAPGRTTIAVNLAVEAARAGVETLLVDADTYGGSVGQMLGLLDDCAGLGWAARQAARGQLDVVGLRRGARRTSADGPYVLTGLPRAELWTELRPAVWEHLLAQIRRAFALAVLDVGFCLEQDEELLYDQVRFRRNAVACHAVQQADVVVAVGRADPVGLHDLVRGFEGLRELGVGAEQVRVVVNQLRPGLFPGDAAEQIRETLGRYLGLEPAAFVPHDRAAVDTATNTARALAEACPASPASRAIADLTRALLGIPAPTRRRWLARRRRAVSAPSLVTSSAMVDP